MIPKVEKRPAATLRERFDDDPYEALAQIEYESRRENRRTRIETRTAYAVAVLIAFVVAIALDGVEDLRKQRVRDQVVTNQVICQRQERALAQVETSKQSIQRTNAALLVNAQILRRLIVGVSSQSPSGSNSPTMIALNRARNELTRLDKRLTRQNTRLAMDVDVLQRELDLLDCEKLPANGPFKDKFPL